MASRGRRACMVVGLALALASATHVASAQGAGGDTVYLKSGGIVRGTIVEYEPADGARVQLSSGEVKTIPAAQIARVVTAGSAAPASPPAAPQPAAPVVDTARLHLVVDGDVDVVGRPNEGYEWVPMCSSPCDKALRLDWEYQVRGAGMKPSSPFQLKASAGQGVVASVDPASKGWFIVGIIGMIGGANVTVVGLYVMLIGAIVQDTSNTLNNGMYQTTQSTSGSILAVGGVITAVGVAAIIGGAVATFSNLSTKVTQGSRSDARFAPPAPAWHTAELRDQPPLPTPIGGPLVTVSF